MDLTNMLMNVSTFYENSWNKLLWVVGFAAGIVGVLMPVLFQLYQRWIVREDKRTQKEEFDRLLKATESNLKTEFERRIGAASEEIEKQKKLLETTQSQLKSEIDKVSNRTFGYTHLNQGQSMFAQRDYGKAIRSYGTAAHHLAVGGDLINAEISLSNVLATLDLVDKSVFRDPLVESSLQSVVAEFSNEKQNDNFRQKAWQISEKTTLAKQKGTSSSQG